MTNTGPAPSGPPPPNVTRAPLFMGIVTTCFILSTLFFIARVYVRIKMTKSFWWDDAILTLAVVCFDRIVGEHSFNVSTQVVSIAEFITQIIVVHDGYGRHIQYINPDVFLYMSHVFYVSELLWVWLVTFIKTSMALLLLRIRRNWFWGMIGLAAFQIIIAVGVTIVQFIRCDPVAATWNPFILNAKCLTPHEAETAVYVQSCKPLILVVPRA
jgi:hypothetical protein